MLPKNPGIVQKDTQKSGSNPIKVPKIMAHPRITTYANYPPGEVDTLLFALFEDFLKSEFLIQDLISRLIVNKNAIPIYQNLSSGVDNPETNQISKIED